MEWQVMWSNSGLEGYCLERVFPLVASPSDTTIAIGDAKKTSKQESKKNYVLNSKK
jgi:hypothetical protein